MCECFELLPVELIGMIAENLVPHHRMKLLRLSKAFRIQLIDTGSFFEPKGQTRYRKDMDHLFKLGENHPESWQSIWFQSPDLSRTDRHELFLSAPFSRRVQLYRIRTVRTPPGCVQPRGLFLCDDGTVLFSDTDSQDLYRILTCGTLVPLPLIRSEPKPKTWRAMGLHPRGEDGSIFIADYNGHQIHLRSADGHLSCFAGTGKKGWSGDGGPALQAHLDDPLGLAMRPNGNLLIAEQGNHCIREIDITTGVISTFAGDPSPRSRDAQTFTGDAGPATRALLNSPSGMAVRADGSVVIADVWNNCVREVSRDGIIRTIAGKPNHVGTSGDEGPAVDAQFDRPFSVGISPLDGSVVIADSFNNQIRVVSAEDGIIDTIAGRGKVSAWEKGTNISEGGPAREAMFTSPLTLHVGKDGTIVVGVCENCVLYLEPYFEVKKKIMNGRPSLLW